MYRMAHPSQVTSLDKWQDFVPRPVLGLFLHVDVQSKDRHLPLAEWAQFELNLDFWPYQFCDNVSLIISFHEKATDWHRSVSFLPPLTVDEYHFRTRCGLDDTLFIKLEKSALKYSDVTSQAKVECSRDKMAANYYQVKQCEYDRLIHKK